jgi:hypothetical protein
MDWQTKGYEAATAGEPLEKRLTYYREECGRRHGVAPDLATFTRGHELGVKYLCTKAGGASLGAQGRLYSGICPKDKEPEFLDGYRTGRQSFLESRVTELEERVAGLQSQVNSQASEISSLRGRLMNCRH